MSSNLEMAKAELTKLRSQAGFDEMAFASWDIPSFAERFGITAQDASDLLRHTRPAASSSRFEWIEAATHACGSGRITQKGLLVANVLFSRFNDNSPYCWPSQETIARSAGWAPTNRQGVIAGLNQLSRIGAIVRIPARDCPSDIARMIFAKKSDGGSGRDIRAMAYKRINISEWQNGNRYTDHTPNKVHEPCTLNHKVQPQPASQDISSRGGLTFNVESIDTFISRTDCRDYTMGDLI